jgi:hypothetical protein
MSRAGQEPWRKTVGWEGGIAEDYRTSLVPANRAAAVAAGQG